MEKIDIQQENATLAAAAILYFTGLVLFSLWFTQS
jgi:hypothetical protein